MAESLWHGLTDEQWLALWDEYGWRHALKLALVEVACCREADVEDRLFALDTLNNAVKDELLAPDETIPEFLIQVLLDISSGNRGRWWKRWYLRPRMHNRIRGALNLERTGAQFTRDIKARAVLREMAGGETSVAVRAADDDPLLS